MKIVFDVVKVIFALAGIFCAVLGVVFLWILSGQAESIFAFTEQLKTAPVSHNPAPIKIGDTVEERYLNLLKRYLVRFDFGNYVKVPFPLNDGYLARHQLALVVSVPVEHLNYMRALGADPVLPPEAETMIGLARLDNIEDCVRDILHRHVPGDLIETGVWRGGATIFMRAILKTYGDTTRTVWVADSFEGLPTPKTEFQIDVHSDWKPGRFAISLDEVKRNFARYGLLDNQVKFLPGWFCNTLPKAPIKQLALLRIDADLYESTTEALRYLYPKLSPGGYVIDDDYACPTAKKAVDDFRAANGITAELKHVDWTGVYWKK